jgi:putative DNA primase/helicase
MGALLDGVVNQFRDRGMPEISVIELKADDKKHLYGPKKKAWYRLNEYVSPKTGKVWLSGVFGFKDEWWKVEHEGFEALSDEERQAAKAEWARKDAEYQAKQQQGYRNAASRARQQLQDAARAGGSAYLVRKQVKKPESVRFMQDDKLGWIIIPLLRYDRGEIVGVQKISPQKLADGNDKLYSSGFEKVGAACRLGDEPIDGDLILIAEGYATAATGREATDYASPVFMALDSGNLPHVARILRAKYPNSPLLFLADDDYLPNKRGDENHAGEKKAFAASQEVGNAVYVLPVFSTERRIDPADELLPKLTDFNDLHIAEGVEVVTQQLQKAIERLLSPKNDIEPAIPAPLPVKPAALADEGSGDELIGLAYMLAYCRGVYGTADMWDAKKKVLLNGSAQKAAFGKERIEEWRNSEARGKDISKQTVKADLANENAGDMCKRFRMIVGGTRSEVWDGLRQCRLPLKVIEDEFPNEFDMWHKHPLRHVRDIESKNIVFDPTCSVDENCFVNTFKGLPILAALNIHVARAKVKPITDLLLHLCNGNEEHYRWAMQWMAFPLQHGFRKKHGSGLLFHSNIHGSGKSLLFERVYSAIYGEYSVTAGAKELESQYNGWRSNKLFSLFEEVLTPKEKMQQSGNIKQMMTAGKVLVSEKFLSTWEEANHMSVVFLSNELRPIPVEPHDRRLFVIWPEKKLLTEEEVSREDELNRTGFRGGCLV